MSHAISLSRATLPTLPSSSSHSHQPPLPFNPISSVKTPPSDRLSRNIHSVMKQAPVLVINPTWPLVDAESQSLMFCKYNAGEYDFVLVDNRDSAVPEITSDQAVILCDRKRGIGGDGIIVAMPRRNATDYTMKVFSSNGSELAICNDAVLCFARFMADVEDIEWSQSLPVHTTAGLIDAEIQNDGKVRVDMGEPNLWASDGPTNFHPTDYMYGIEEKIDLGEVSWSLSRVRVRDAHCVIVSALSGKDLCIDDLNLAQIGPKFGRWFPASTNTGFVEVLSPHHLKVHVWEHGRGATLASGAGACAAVVTAVLEGRAGRICTVDLPGGPVEIEWSEKDNHVYMTGAAERAFFGVFLFGR